MMSKKDEISLIMESHNRSCLELWFLGEERGEESANSASNFSIEIVENEFRVMVGWSAVTVNILVECLVRDFENRSWSFR